MSKMQQDFVSPPERGQDLAILTYGKEALAAVVRDRLIPNGIKKRHQHTVARGPVPRNAWPPCCRCVNRFFCAASL